MKPPGECKLFHQSEESVLFSIFFGRKLLFFGNVEGVPKGVESVPFAKKGYRFYPLSVSTDSTFYGVQILPLRVQIPHKG